jgi:hypothetical protein
MTKADKQAKELAALKREVAELKAAQPKPAADPPKPRPLTKEEQDAWSREMDELRHRNERYVPPWLREACAGGVNDRDARAIAATARALTGRPGVIPQSDRGAAARGDYGAADVVYRQPANVSRGTNQRTWEERMRFTSDEQPEKKP